MFVGYIVILRKKQKKTKKANLVVSVLKTCVTVCVHQRGQNIGGSNRA